MADIKEMDQSRIEDRLGKVENRLERIEAGIPFLATKADLSDLSAKFTDKLEAQTRWMAQFVLSIVIAVSGGLVTVTYLIAKYVH